MSRHADMGTLTRLWAAMLVGAVAAVVLVLAVTAPHARADGTSCPPGTTCITGKLLIRDPGSDTVHQFLILEKNGAAMLAVNMFGVFSYGEPVCSTGLDLQPLACLGGPQGSYGGQPVVTLYAHGRAYSLTARDITWIHAHGG